MMDAFRVMRHMYPDLTEALFQDHLASMVHRGYSMLGVVKEQVPGYVGVAGYWIGYRLYCGKYIQVDNLVILPEHRGQGVGKLIMDEIKVIGHEEQCKRVLLDSYVENFEAHRFFYREGFIARGYHMNYLFDE